MKANHCFHCRNCADGGGEKADDPGTYRPCKLGLLNEGLLDIEQCKSYLPNKGFQMGGYYTHTHFEKDDPIDADTPGCLTLVIHGDLQFPKDDPAEWTYIHICEFDQIKEWVEFWDKELKKR